MRPRRTTGFLSGAERWRLASGVLMLIVLLLLIGRVGDPNTWRWLTTQKPSAPQRPAKAAPIPKPTGPTDEDSEEADAAREEFQAVTDGGTKLGREEMEAYDRLVAWAKSQSFARLWRRGKKGLAYTYLYDDAENRRGTLVALDVEVRLVREAGRTRQGVPLYEAWAATDESRGRLYDLIVVDFPRPIPEGQFIREKAKFAGYFLKLQGYESGAAKPGQRPQRAPLLIGRLEWTPAAAPLVDNTREWYWGAILVAAIALVFAVRYFFFRKKPPRRAPPRHGVTSPSGEVIPVDVWLERAGRGELEDEEDRPNNDNPPRSQ